MEFYSKKQPDHFALIKGIFYLIFGSALLGVILLLTLNINRKASVSDGQIISQNAPIKYLAPSVGMISSINVKEGDNVMAGDILIVMANPEIEQRLIKKKRALEATKANLKYHQEVLNNLGRTIARQRKQLELLNTKFDHAKEENSEEAEILDSQLANYNEKFKISERNLKSLKKLYEDGGISGNEYEKRYKSYLDEQNRLISFGHQVHHKEHEVENLSVKLEQDVNKMRMSLIESESDNLKKRKDIIDDQRKIEQLEDEIYAAELAVESLTLRATIDGTITDLFTTKLKTTSIQKDQMLCVLNPSVEQEFFAKVKLKEEEIKDIIPGQKVHLRLPAFNHYQYGVLKGEVQHVNKEVIKEEESTQPEKAEDTGDFYALVSIPDDEATKFNIKSGFKVSGDIILNRVKLYRFIFESMFMK